MQPATPHVCLQCFARLLGRLVVFSFASNWPVMMHGLQGGQPPWVSNVTRATTRCRRGQQRQSPLAAFWLRKALVL